MILNCFFILLTALIDECVVASTFQPILHRVAELPLQRASFQLNTRAISFTSQSNPQGKVKVHVGIEGGATQSFDEVIITSPLGWLKANMETFEPAITSKLRDAFDAISIGHLEKVISIRALDWEGLMLVAGLYLVSNRILEESREQRNGHSRLYQLAFPFLCP
jgi:hypothetical protein